MRIALRILLPLLVLGAGWLLMKKYAVPEDDTAGDSWERPERPAQKAELLPLERQDYQIVLRTRGVIQAHSTAQLTSRTAGRIESLNENFEPGAFFEKGDILVTLDPTDTEAAIVAAEAAVAQAQATLLQEEARSKQAEMNWQDLGYTEKPNDLVLRIPQLKGATANLATATARLAEAKRSKLYTKVVAPFDGCVRTRLVGPGQSVGTGTSLGEIFATDYAEVRLPVSPRDLPFTPFQTENEIAKGSATIRDGLNSDLGDDAPSWTANIVRSEGVIDETSRELFLVARIPDPYGLQSDQPPLRIGQPIVAEIPANELQDVFVIPRSSLLGAFEALLVDNETMKIKRYDIEPVWEDQTNMVVAQELPDNHSVVMTRLASAANGSIIEEIVPESEEVEVKAANAPTAEDSNEA